ncbi:hypothetical protein M0R45_015626 [Rubus argutus]|uniref:rRNA adenine N(6)-methyltransferase n=1 Tax=Rubus argutus TaxID=59490 RepID=A0AAW1XQ74_RUBAR
MAGGKARKEKAKPAAQKPYQGGISSHKSKGQHILKNLLLVDSIVHKSGIKATDVILAIGPGTRNLTKKLLEAGKKATPHSNRLQIIQGDVLKTELPYFDICVANIPLSNLITPHLQVIASQTCFQMSHYNVPKGICNEADCTAPETSFTVVLLLTPNAWLKQKKVLSLLEKNYKTLQALNLDTALQGAMEETNNVIHFEDMEMDDDEADDEMEVEDGNAEERRLNSKKRF